MEFPDNLKRIRKENNLSQEQFAEKLGVSRQAVSKWESGQSYPEMDKVIQICKLYNFNIDELLNQNVKQINEDIDSKVNMNKYIEGFLSYISKTVNMFCAMKFGQKIKCLFEQGVIIITLLIIFSIIGGIGGSIVDNIISIFPRNAYNIISNILASIYMVIALAAGTTIFVYLFKIRYLDYYKIIRREDKNENKLEKNNTKTEEVKEEKALVDNSEKENILELPKSEKIIFRDPKDSQFKFVTAIAKIMIFCMKIFVCFIAFWAVLSFVCIIVATVLSFLISKSGALFTGILISLISSGIINYVILEVCYNFIVNRKASKTRIGLMLIVPLVTLGIGIGVALLGSYNIDIIESNDQNYEKQEVYEVEMKDKLFLNCGDVEYIEEERDNVKIVADCMNYTDIKFELEEYPSSNHVYIWNYSEDGFLEHLKRFVDEVNEKKINIYKDYKITVYASKENIQKLKRYN